MGFYLREYLDKLNGELDDYIKNYSDAIEEDIFLRIISVVHSKSCREKELLSLSTETILDLWNIVGLHLWILNNTFHISRNITRR